MANAIPNESAMPMTSPVERISGPRTRSTPASLLKGKTASFTATYGLQHVVLEAQLVEGLARP